MVKAELNYNPYLLETTIKFNGQEPRINSLVEKFQEGSLERWVRRIPDIFYDEMNGYNFELEFSGTERDFLEIVDAFRRKGITEDLVRVFHKNELDGRKEKSELIDDLLEWFAKNPNRNFDIDMFREENADLFNNSYVYIIFQGTQLSMESPNNRDIAVEHVNSVEELSDTELSNTPILMYIAADNIADFQKNLRYFLERKDVEHAQLFFLISPSLDAGKVERIIKDLGVCEPCLVLDVFDDAIKKYIELYPVSEYIYSIVSVFRKKITELDEYLEKESEKCAAVNREVHVRIDEYECIISRLKEINQNFINRDNLELSIEWSNVEAELISLISNWRKRKTKITDDHEAEKVANEFETDVRNFYKQFVERITCAVQTTKQDIDSTYESWYRNAEFDVDYQLERPEFIIPEFEDDISFSYDLLKLVEEKYVEPKEDILGLFFKSASGTSKEPVLQRTFYYQNWRDYVLSVVRPKEETVVNVLFENIRKYESAVAEKYIAHLTDLIEEQTQMKKREAEKLSDEERLLQNDIDWLIKVKDQLKNIERG